MEGVINITSFSRAIITCPNGHKQSVIYHQSICSWLDGNENLQLLLEGKLHIYECKECGASMQIKSWVLVNCKKGMFTIKGNDSLETIRELFEQHDLLDENGNVVNEMFGGYGLKGPPKSRISKEIPPPPPNPGELFKLTSKEEVQVERKFLSETDKIKLKDYLERKKKRDFYQHLR